MCPLSFQIIPNNRLVLPDPGGPQTPIGEMESEMDIDDFVGKGVEDGPAEVLDVGIVVAFLGGGGGGGVGVEVIARTPKH